MARCKFLGVWILAAMLAGLSAFAYDIHTKALTPIAEKPVPDGEPMQFVEDGELKFAIVTDDAKRDAKAVALLREVFGKTTGRTPLVQTPEAAAKNGLPFSIVLRQDAALPKEGFSIKTSKGGEYLERQRLRPIPQPIDVEWKAEGHEYKAVANENGWTAELFVPFSAFEDGAPKAYDSWNFNCAVTHRARRPALEASTSLTGQFHATIDMFGIIRFGGRGD